MALKIVRGVMKSPARVVIYGTEGIGKSTLASQFPDPVILDTEEGTGQLDVARVVCHEATELEAAMHDLARDAQGFRTVVIDSADWAERHIVDALLRKSGKKSIEDFGFGKGYVMLSEAVAKVLAVCDQLVARGLHVVWVAHSKVVRTSPPDETDGFDRYELKLTKQTAPLFKEWCDALLFCNYRTQLIEGADGRKKGRGGKERVMYAQRAAAFDAKNRYGLPESMPMEIGQLERVLHGSSAATKAAVGPAKKGLRQMIAEAETVEQLGQIGDLIDEQTSKGRLTEEQVAELMGCINSRHAEIEPQGVAS
jgi:hypothetical protein